MKKNIVCGLIMMAFLFQRDITAQVTSPESRESARPDAWEKKLKESFKSNFDAGDDAPDFTQKDMRGNSISMKQFRGKYVLLDFWASWCKPCRASSWKLVRLYNQYRSHNFDILSISIDNSKDLWMNAVVDDRMYFWSHILDDRAGDSSVYKMFGLNAVPSYFLVDPGGKIVNRYMTVEALEKEVRQIFDTTQRGDND